MPPDIDYDANDKPDRRCWSSSICLTLFGSGRRNLILHNCTVLNVLVCFVVIIMLFDVALKGLAITL